MSVEPMEKVAQEAQAVDNGDFRADLVELAPCVLLNGGFDSIRCYEQVVVDPLSHAADFLDRPVDVVDRDAFLLRSVY